MALRNLLFVIFIAVVVNLYNCSLKKYDERPDPKETLIKYRELRNEWKLGEAYSLIADTCKSYISKEEFITYNMQPDSVRNNYKFTITTIDSLPVFENSDFARFKVKYQSIILDKKDTLLGSWDYRLLFEDGSWKIIWFGRMASIASDHLQNQQYDQSLVLYMVICAVDPYNDIAMKGLALSYINLSQNNEAITAAQRLVQLKPDDPTAHTLLGDLYGSAEQFDKAIEAYSKAIEIKPEPVFYVNLGSVYKMNGQFVEADDSYRKSIELDSLSPQGWWMLGELYLYNLDDRAMAKTFYNKALQLKPMSDYYQMRLYYGYALLLYSDAVETDPDEISADEREWLQEAKTYIGKALKIDPRSSEFSYLSNEINKQLMGS
jgi:tetratricopeptide (TPR) repeat protein